MTWTDHIHTDPAVSGGKQVVKGTRLAVDFVPGLLTEGWSQDDLRKNYPQLTLVTRERRLHPPNVAS